MRVNPVSKGILPVVGAGLYYRMHGSGPLLLMLESGPGDAEASDGIARFLTDHYTVLTYDRRGLSRSRIDTEPQEPLRLETHGDDAHLLLSALATEPALVVGSSIGALIGLDLVARHPEHVRALVAHEPPLLQILPDTEQAEVEEFLRDVEETCARDGAVAAMRKVAVAIGGGSEREPDAILPRRDSQRAANMEFSLANDIGAMRRYRLDVVALLAAPTPIIPAAGVASQDLWQNHCAHYLAELVGARVAEFPGGHNGFLLQPRKCAGRLHEVLLEVAARRP